MELPKQRKDKQVLEAIFQFFGSIVFISQVASAVAGAILMGLLTLKTNNAFQKLLASRKVAI